MVNIPWTWANMTFQTFNNPIEPAILETDFLSLQRKEVAKKKIGSLTLTFTLTIHPKLSVMRRSLT